MSRRIVLMTGAILLVAGTFVAVSAQERPEEPKKEQTTPPPPPREESRLDSLLDQVDKLDRLELARRGYATAVWEGFPHNRRQPILEEIKRIPVWSLRIRDCEIRAGVDVVKATEDHLRRMKHYANTSRDCYRIGEMVEASYLDARFVLFEAEDELEKAKKESGAAVTPPE